MASRLKSYSKQKIFKWEVPSDGSYKEKICLGDFCFTGNAAYLGKTDCIWRIASCVYGSI